MSKQDIEELGWIFFKKGDPFHFEALVFKIEKEWGFNTGIEYHLIIYPNQPKLTISWVSYGSYGGEDVTLQLLIDNKTDLHRFMKQIQIINE